MKRTKYKGGVNFDIRPLDQKIKDKRIKPGQKADAVEQSIFTVNDNSDLELEPAYVKKYLSHGKTCF
jgi:hypothetical protein